MARRLIVRRSAIHGTGVFAGTALDAEVELIEYKGRLISHAEADRRYGDSAEGGHTFLFTLNDRFIIDGNREANSARWFNHSCDPNCIAVIVENADGDPRRDKVVIETLRAVEAGDELTYDYGIVLEQPHTARMKRIWACRCGVPGCTGTMLKPKPRRRG